MQPLDPTVKLSPRRIDDHLAFADDRRFVLADLIALRRSG